MKFFPVFGVFMLLTWSFFDDKMLWRERDLPELCTALVVDGQVCQQLVRWGLLKFVENDLLQS